jgi:hypothetical protein
MNSRPQDITVDDGLPCNYWYEYHSQDEINAFLDNAAVHAGDFASVVSIGKSVEGIEMKVLSLIKAGPGAPNVWIEAGKQWTSNCL